MPYLCLWRRNFCVTGECFFSYSGAIFERSRSLFSLTAAAQNMHVFLRKSPLFKEHFFGWLKTANISIVCGTATLKSLLSQAFFVPDVHPRPRKRPPRCTLDCGFKTSESPALRGFVGGLRALATAALYLVLLSNRQVPSTIPHRRGESGGKQRRCLSGVQGCHPRPQSRTQRLTGADTAVTSASPKSVPAPHKAVGHTRAGSCRSAAGKTPPSCAVELPARPR